MNDGWAGVPKNIKNYLGFVYVISHKESGKYYIGKKLFWNQVRRKPLKGKKRVRCELKESDWMSYWGSSNKFIEYVEREGKDKFRREIIVWCKSKFDLSLAELQKQLEYDVLFDPDSFNEIINVRLRKAK